MYQPELLLQFKFWQSLAWGFYSTSVLVVCRLAQNIFPVCWFKYSFQLLEMIKCKVWKVVMICSQINWMVHIPVLVLFHLSWDGILEKWWLCALGFSRWSWSEKLHLTISMCNCNDRGFIYYNFIAKSRYVMEEVLFSISLHCRIQMCWSHWRKPLRLYAVMSAGTMANSWAVVIQIRKHHWIRLLSCCWLQSSVFKNAHVSCGMYAVAYVWGDGLHSGTCKLCL